MPASTIEMAAALNVPISPGMRYCVQASAVRNGCHRALSNWFASSSLT